MSPGTLARRLWERFRSWERGDDRPWGDRCAVGAPVPEEERCRAFECPTLPMTSLPVRAWGVVSCLEAPTGDAARKLASLGLLPGTDVQLVQTFPVFVVRSGYTEIALDGALARHVRVHPLGR